MLKNNKINTLKFTYIFIAPADTNSKSSLVGRDSFIINCKHSSNLSSIHKFQSSIKTFLKFIKYVFYNNLKFLSLSTKLFSSFIYSLNYVSGNEYGSAFSKATMQSLANRKSLLNSSLHIFKLLYQHRINMLFLFNSEGYIKLTRLLYVNQFFLVGMSDSNSVNRNLSLSLTVNSLSNIKSIAFIQLILATKLDISVSKYSKYRYY
jgi:hypothetical protein